MYAARSASLLASANDGKKSGNEEGKKQQAATKPNLKSALKKPNDGVGAGDDGSDNNG